MLVINIILAITAAVYWYMTGNWWLAAIGLLASTIVTDKMFIVVIFLAALIGYACIYYILKDSELYLQLQNLEILVATFIYMVVATIKGMLVYWG